MNGLDTWFKFHTSLVIKSRKFLSLPDNDHRWLFVALMSACKMGWISQQGGLLANATPMLLSISGMNHRKFKRVSNGLINCGLVADNLWVIGFEESQLTPEAFRKRRQRSRDNGVTKGVTSHGTSHGDSRKQKVEKKPPKPPKGGRVDPRVEDAARLVTDAINAQWGTAWNPTKELLKAVGALLKDGHTPEDIQLVARVRCAEEWYHPRKWPAVALVRPTKFESQLQRIKEAPPSAAGQFNQKEIDENRAWINGE